MKLLHNIAILSMLALSAHGQEYNVSWIANDGGWEESHVPHDMLNMYVHPDGTVATICNWDEGGTNVGVFKDGKLISRPEGSGTGGWGRFSCLSVVLDDKYVYQLLTQHGCDGGNNKLNENNLPQFPPCDETIEWKTVRRYHRSSGQGAPFACGYGYKGDMLVVCKEKPRTLKGLAINGNMLYIAVTGMKEKNQPDSIKIYNTENMSFVGGYPLNGTAGVLYADNRGGLWMMQDKKIIRMNANDGELLPQQIIIPKDVKALSFSIDIYKNRLLLPNRGKNLNILIYENIYKKPKLANCFGQKGGIFSVTKKYKKGEVGELRFTGPTGAGVDSKGNIYICNTAISGGRGAVLEAYNERVKKRLWKTEGLIFTATADIDRQNLQHMYTPEKIHKVNYDIVGGRMDEVVAYTADPFTFPDDERVLTEGGSFITSCWKRTIEGNSFLFVSDMYGGMVAGYRFDEKKHGYVAIPFLFANNGDPGKRKLRFWVDKDGNGVRNENEWNNIDEVNPFSMSFFVDSKGNIWRGSREQGILFWKIKELNKEGIPQYEAAKLLPLPQGCNGVKRLWYDADNDEMFVCGFSNESPDSGDTWWCMGSTIVKCSNYLKNMNKGRTTANMRIFIPFHHEDSSTKHHTNAKAFCVEGDYIFVAIAREGIINVYDRNTGEKYCELRPDASVHYQSGWSDFNYCINAYRKSDGTYIIMNEENAFAKVLVYRMKK